MHHSTTSVQVEWQPIYPKIIGKKQFLSPRLLACVVTSGTLCGQTQTSTYREPIQTWTREPKDLDSSMPLPPLPFHLHTAGCWTLEYVLLRVLPDSPWILPRLHSRVISHSALAQTEPHLWLIPLLQYTRRLNSSEVSEDPGSAPATPLSGFIPKYVNSWPRPSIIPYIDWLSWWVDKASRHWDLGSSWDMISAWCWKVEPGVSPLIAGIWNSWSCQRKLDSHPVGLDSHHVWHIACWLCFLEKLCGVVSSQLRMGGFSRHPWGEVSWCVLFCV